MSASAPVVTPASALTPADCGAIAALEAALAAARTAHDERPPLEVLAGALAELGAPAKSTHTSIEKIAERVAQHILEHERPPDPERRLISAAELARTAGLSRAWVYEHADHLGAIRIGTGPKPRLRFNPDAAALLTPSRDNRLGPDNQRQAHRPKPVRTAQPAVELLPIHQPTASR